jgi:predicted dehydrogenase/threonine dehydrogenase-like Zn-dependent dehydrogenase
MKQLLQSLADGQTIIEEVPTPKQSEGKALIQTSVTLVSSGTERMLVEFGQANLFQKAKQQPEKVREVIEKAQTDGLLTTLDAVKSKLDRPIPLGYCNVGRVCDSNLQDYPVGMRVVSNGYHAEVVSAAKNLMAQIPDNVDDNDAVFTVIGAIALQGVRLAIPAIGETVAVFGMGLIGLLTVQILRAHGCRVLAIDIDDKRLAIAKKYGAATINSKKNENLFDYVTAFTRDLGCDAVLITAATDSNEIISQAAKISRKRGRIILTGVVGLNINRADFYEKELTFQVSCSYGPGRYDQLYEEMGNDYPVAFVRWTEQRNFVAVLDLMSEGKICTKDLISHVFLFEEAQSAMRLLTSKEESLGILFKYQKKYIDNEEDRLVVVEQPKKSLDNRNTQNKSVTINVIGSGNYASRVLIPAFSKTGAVLNSCVSAGGISAIFNAKKFGFKNASTDANAAFSDQNANCVIVATRHNQHAKQVLTALQSGKHVFCEKPLCLTKRELQTIENEALMRPDQLLMVGFNRRFSPLIERIKELLKHESSPKNIIIKVNAGYIPPEHWVHDPDVGGGRIIGEACHFIDLSRFIIGASIRDTHVTFTGNHKKLAQNGDQASIILKFTDGSVATILYLSSGHKAYPKETIDVFVSGKILTLNNFRSLKGYGWNTFRKQKLLKQNKGQFECASAFVSAIKKQTKPPICKHEIFEVTRHTIEIAERLNA